MTKRERVKALRKTLGKTQLQFAEELGLGFSAVSHAERQNGTSFYSRKVMEKMGELYNVNLDWILTGSGKMFRTESSDSTQVQSSGPNVLVVSVDANNEEWVAVVPEYALASYSEGYRDTNFISELPIETVPDDLRTYGTIRKFQVYGDSMEPEFHHGDWVYCSYVDTTQSRPMGLKIRDRHIYVIISRERGPLLKRVSYSEGEEYLQCYSTNPSHKPFDLHLSEIRELWYVRRKYTGHFAGDNDLVQMQKNISDTNRRIEELEEDLKKMIGKKG